MGQAMGQIRAGQFDGRLTPLAVKRLGKPGLHADGNGLYLRISEGGGRAWLLFVHVRGKRREMGLGSVKLYNLAEARERARKYRQIAHAGKDPIAERDKEKAANAAELASRRTFRECAVEYIRLHEAQWRNAKFKKDWPASLESYVYPKMGDTDIRDISKADVLKALEPIWHTKTETATRVKSRIRMVLEWAAARGYCTPEPRLGRRARLLHAGAAVMGRCRGITAQSFEDQEGPPLSGSCIYRCTGHRGEDQRVVSNARDQSRLRLHHPDGRAKRRVA